MAIMKNILGNSRWGGGRGGYEKGRYNVLVEDIYPFWINDEERLILFFYFHIIYFIICILFFPFQQPSQRKQKKKYFTFWDYAFIYFIHIKDE